MQPAANPVIRALGRFLSKFKIQDEKTSVPEAADFMRALSYNVITQVGLLFEKARTCIAMCPSRPIVSVVFFAKSNLCLCLH